MTKNIEVLTHSSIRITAENGKKIYVDPFQVDEVTNDADIILVTHDHFDHFSKEDIDKVIGKDTIMVAPESMKELAESVPCGGLITVVPGDVKDVDGIGVEAVPSYNVNKQFHPKENNWVGYILTVDGVRIYIAGDTDINEDNKLVSCDVAMVPIGGVYTITAEEAAELVNIIKPKVAIPTHYGNVAGEKECEDIFRENVDASIPVEVKMQKYK